MYVCVRLCVCVCMHVCKLFVYTKQEDVFYFSILKFKVIHQIRAITVVVSKCSTEVLVNFHRNFELQTN